MEKTSNQKYTKIGMVGIIIAGILFLISRNELKDFNVNDLSKLAKSSNQSNYKIYFIFFIFK